MEKYLFQKEFKRFSISIEIITNSWAIPVFFYRFKEAIDLRILCLRICIDWMEMPF